MPHIVPNGFDIGLLSRDDEFRRLRVQGLSIGMQYISDGIGFTTNWIELGVATSSSRYATFDVPAGYKMALDFRLVNPSGELVWYHVYPQGTYTLGAAKPNDATGTVKTRNLRQDSPFTQPNIATRYNVTTPPTRLTDSLVDSPHWGEAPSSSGNKSSNELAPDDSFLLLNGGQQFLLQVFNNGAGNSHIQVLLNYALIPESRVGPVEV